MNSYNASFGKETTLLPSGFKFQCSRSIPQIPSWLWTSHTRSFASSHLLCAKVWAKSGRSVLLSKPRHGLPEGTASFSLSVSSHNSSDSPENLCLERNTDVCSRWASSLLLTRTPGACCCVESDECQPSHLPRPEACHSSASSPVKCQHTTYSPLC